MLSAVTLAAGDTGNFLVVSENGQAAVSVDPSTGIYSLYTYRSHRLEGYWVWKGDLPLPKDTPVQYLDIDFFKQRVELHTTDSVLTREKYIFRRIVDSYNWYLISWSGPVN